MLYQQAKLPFSSTSGQSISEEQDFGQFNRLFLVHRDLTHSSGFEYAINLDMHQTLVVPKGDNIKLDNLVDTVREIEYRESICWYQGGPDKDDSALAGTSG